MGGWVHFYARITQSVFEGLVFGTVELSNKPQIFKCVWWGGVGGGGGGGVLYVRSIHESLQQTVDRRYDFDWFNGGYAVSIMYGRYSSFPRNDGCKTNG